MFYNLNSSKLKKGFTLVELIVVLAILAVLAGILVPSLTGYIDKAKKAKSLANARGFLNAAQTVCSELYALDRESVCNNGTDEFACKVMIPITNTKEAPPDYKNNNQYYKYRRYRDTYDLFLEYLEQDTKFEAIAFVDSGVVKHIRYKELGANYLLEWTTETEKWMEIPYAKNTAWVFEVTSKCGRGNINANWNGRDDNGNPN